jgi:mercuric ion transport protein
MKDKSLAIGSTVAAFLASLCCLGPLVLGGAGLGAALVATFAPLRPYFLAVSAILLAGGFYFVYRKPKAAEACAGETCAPESGTRRMAKPLLWLATLAVAALAFFPSYGVKLIGKPAAAAPISSATLQTAELKITGMDCPVCSGVIQRKLLETPGVVKAEVRYPAGSAIVQFNPTQTDTSKLIAVVKDTGYKAAVSNSAQD